MRHLLIAASILISTATALSAGQSALSGKLGSMANALASGYARSPAAKQSPTAAVFTFNTSGKLARQRVGFAVSEILSHRMTTDGKFKLLERTELNKVLHELKLNMSGVTSQDEALKAGKLAAADVLVLGSVEKFGETYHINARLVQAESGEILATAYESVTAETFETEAQGYITLVPKTQAISLYFLNSFRGTASLDPMTGYKTMSPYTYTTTTVPDEESISLPGLGIRYSPFEDYLLDISFSNTAKAADSGRATVSYTDNATQSGSFSYKYTIKMSALRFLFSRRLELGKRMICYLSAGATAIKIGGEGAVRYTTATVGARAEYRPQERIGLSLMAGYDFTAKTAVGEEWMGTEFPVAKLKKIYLEPSVSINF